MMKRFVCILLCICMYVVSTMPLSVFSYGGFEERVLPARTYAYEKYNPEKGNAWLANQEAVEKALAEAQNVPKEDTSIYNFAKESTIIYLGQSTAYVNGYEVYISHEKKGASAIVQNGITYVPVSFAIDYIGVNAQLDEDGSTAVVSVVSEEESSEEVKSLRLNLLNYDELLYMPLRAACEASGKKVIYDERGVVIITTQKAVGILTAGHLKQIASEDFALDRNRVMHPQPIDIMKWSLSSDDRAVLDSSDEVIEENIAPYIKMSYKELAEHIEKTVQWKDDGTQRHIGNRPTYEKAILMMAAKYDKEPSEDLALRIIIMGYYSAIHFDDLATHNRDDFYNYLFVPPQAFIYATDRIYHAKAWDIFRENFGFDAKDVFRLWWTTISDYLTINGSDADGKKMPTGNYPVQVPYIAGMAFVLDDPDMMRDAIEFMDASVSRDQFYADGMWYEGSFDYGHQAVGNSSPALNFIKAYTDPLDYTDEKLGLHLGGAMKLDRWKDVTNYVSTLRAKASYPDGSPLAVNDTHWNSVESNLKDNTIKEKHLEKNIEFNHFGLFGLKYGDLEEAQQITLNMVPVTDVSHQHDGFLGMTYYSAGMELLPDHGYVTSSDLYRYSKTSAYSHNTATAWDAVPSGYYTRPNVRAYDDGSTNDKQVQLIEAEVLMPVSVKMSVNRRTIMMIATDKNHSYAVDLHRIKGKITPESYLMQSEEENVEFSTDLEFSPAYNGTLGGWISFNGEKNGVLSKHYESNIIKNPQGTKTSDGFNFSWKGKTTGTSLNAFIKGNDEQLVAFATYPTVRRTNKKVAMKDDFPGYYLYRRSTESVNKVTTFGGVYEGIKDGAEAFVQNVEWKDAPDGDDMTTMVKVELRDCIDYIYTSNDLKARSFDGFTFSGTNVFVRVNKESGEVLRSYIYGEGAISIAEYNFAGKEDRTYRVLNAKGTRPSEKVQNNQLRVEGILPEGLKGYWCNVTFSDGSGTAFRIVDTNASTLTVHNDPGFYVTEEGATFTAFPMYHKPGTDEVATFDYPFGRNMEQRITKGEVVLNIRIPSYYCKGGI